MVDSDSRRRVISSGPRLTRADIQNATFPQAFRGISETAVRGFLRKVADEFDALLVRQDELEALVEELEARLAEPPPPAEEPDLLTAVGEETARVLRSAKESADEIRRSAEERAAQLLEEAQSEARSLRQAAEQVMAERTREAEESSAEMIREAERLARETHEQAEARAREFQAQAQGEARAELDAAKRRSKELVAEAQATRDRLVQELTRRREALETQVDTLRVGRDRLLDAYRVVKRTLEEATEALREADTRAPAAPRRRVSSPALPVSPPDDGAAQGGNGAVPEVSAPAEEPPAAVDEPLAPGPDHETPTEPAPAAPRVTSFALGELDDAGHRQVGEDEPAPPQAVVRVIAPRVDTSPSDDASEGLGSSEEAPEEVAQEEAQAGDAEPSGEQRPAEVADDGSGAGHTEAEVEEIFARLRAGQDDDAAAADGDEEPAHTESSEQEGDAVAEPDVASSEPLTGDGLVLARRTEALEALVPDLVRAVKRVVRDEQNLVLEATRRHKGIPAAEDVLPTVASQDAAFAEAAADCLLAGCAAGEAMVRELGYPGVATDPDRAVIRAAELAAGLARVLMDPLRGRLADALGEAASMDDPDVEERVRARYREWKHQRIDEAAGDAVAAAFARGIFDAVPAGVSLRWLATTDQPCPDCADNGLEEAVRGETFPTGHILPPAHPGCRCLAVPADAAPAVATG